MRILFYFAWLGPLFCILGCTVGILFIPDNYIDGIMYVSFFSILVNRTLRPFINCKRIIEDEIPDKFIIKKLGLNHLELNKWKEDLIKKARQRIYSPVVAFIGFLCLIVFCKINWQEASMLRYPLLILIFLAIWQIIESFIEPKLKEKHRPNIIVQ